MIYIIPILLSIHLANASIMQYPEDAYLMAAPQEIAEAAHRAAQIMGFQDNYYVIAPKKPALEINPWNKFIAHGLHPENKIPLIIINPEWFNALPQDEQTFLLGRCFGGFQHGITPWSSTAFPFLWTMFVIMLAAFMILGINQTRLSKEKIWVKLLMVYTLLIVCNLAFLNTIQQNISQHLLRRHDHYIHTCVIDKAGNKQAAISALENYDQAIKQETTKGDPFWKPFENLFADYAQRIKQEDR